MDYTDSVRRCTATYEGICNALSQVDAVSPVVLGAFAGYCVTMSDNGYRIPRHYEHFDRFAQHGLIDPKTGEIFSQVRRATIEFARERGEIPHSVGGLFGLLS